MSIEHDVPPPVVLEERRDFLKSAAMLTGVLVANSAIGLLAPSRAWALEVQHLSQAQADKVLALVKSLFPHEGLPDAVYALAVKDVDALAADKDGAGLVASGVKALDGAVGGSWLKASPARRHQAIEALMPHDPFVQKVRATCITALYDNDMAYAHFGYEGEAFSKGGYVQRGFNDLTWLPNPPDSAGPPYT